MEGGQDDRWKRIWKSIERAKLGDNEERRINIRGMRLSRFPPPISSARGGSCARLQSPTASLITKGSSSLTRCVSCTTDDATKRFWRATFDDRPLPVVHFESLCLSSSSLTPVPPIHRDIRERRRRGDRPLCLRLRLPWIRGWGSRARLVFLSPLGNNVHWKAY